jgi:O-methyltransferase
MLRPKLRALARSLFVNSVGRMPDVNAVFDKTASWIRFSHWCMEQGGKVASFRATPTEYEKRYNLYESIVTRENLDSRPFRYLEFGVASGASILWWANRCKNPEHRFVGFDSFMGLPEDWETAPQGRFSTAGKPPETQDNRCSFEVGLFQDTLPPFVKRFDRGSSRLIVHLDADLYSSTLYAMASLAPFFASGDLLFFDEFASVRHEFRALEDFVKAFRFDYEVIGAVSNFDQVCLKLV